MKITIAKDNYWKLNGGMVRAYRSFAGFTFGLFSLSISIGPKGVS